MSKLAAEYSRDLFREELDRCIKDNIVTDEEDCTAEALDFVLKIKSEERKFQKRIVEFFLQLHAHNVSGFDIWTILKNLSCDKRVVDINKKGKGIIEFQVFDGYVQDNKKQIPQYPQFRCGMTRLKIQKK